MTSGLSDALQASYTGLAPMLGLLEPPHESGLRHDEPWSVAQTRDGQHVGKDHDWRVEGDRFIASGVWHDDVPDEAAKEQLQALIDTWKAQGKDDLVEALACCEDGIHWERITTSVERPYALDVPLADVTFTRYWWDRPWTVSFGGPIEKGTES